MTFNSFDVNLLNKLCESSDENKNFSFSPLSISLVMCILLLGSEETTKKEPKKALGVNKDDEILGKLTHLKYFGNFSINSVKFKDSISINPSKVF